MRLGRYPFHMVLRAYNRFGYQSGLLNCCRQ